MKKKQISLAGGSKFSEKRPVTLEELRRVMGAEVASGGSTPINDPVIKDTKPPGT